MRIGADAMTLDDTPANRHKMRTGLLLSDLGNTRLSSFAMNQITIATTVEVTTKADV